MGFATLFYLVFGGLFIWDTSENSPDVSSHKVEYLGAILIILLFVATFFTLLIRLLVVILKSEGIYSLRATSEALIPERTAVVVIILLASTFVLSNYLFSDLGDTPDQLPEGVAGFIMPLLISAPFLEAVITGPHKFVNMLNAERCAKRTQSIEVFGEDDD